jgi:hypothetical protein
MLNRTLPSQRGPLLAALEPWIMADGVTRVGPVNDALSGSLWWPHPLTWPGKDRQHP